MHSTEVRYHKGVGPKLSKLLSKLGIETIKDLIYYFPREYEDRRNPVPVSELVIGQNSLIKVKLQKISSSRTKRGFWLVKGTIADNSGLLKIIWFNQPYLARILKPGTVMFISGKLDNDNVFIPRDYEVIGNEKYDLIVPKYNLTEGLYQKTLRKLVRSAVAGYLDKIEDNLPESIKEKYKLADLRPSIMDLHLPSNMKVISSARKRIAFDELLDFQLGLMLNSRQANECKGISFEPSGELIDRFEKSLPFTLTRSQRIVLGEIISDMKSAKVMNRLLQGDIGCGKTIVAIYAAVIAIQNGYQVAVMAPTEILASQHYNKIKDLLKGMGIDVFFMTASNRSERKELLLKLGTDEPLIIVGTHALIEEKVNFGRLGLAIIDEQHRFGVDQRIKLRQKGQNIDLIVMTATPIPRTLALTLYGDLDRSVINEMPPGRTKVTTRYIQVSERNKLYDFIRKEISVGRQVYVVCPLIEESEVIDLRAAEKEEKSLQKIFPEYEIALIHGRMKSEQKNKIMKSFNSGKINILVSTTVIEVGIDVPNATIMMIEHSERFGLSQLHQLRGRIGRGSERSYCFLVGEPKTENSKARIKVMLQTTDGFKIAEEDLKLRGPGEFLGVRQWGLPNFRVADIIRDEDIMREAREAANILLNDSDFLNKTHPISRGSRLE